MEWWGDFNIPKLIHETNRNPIFPSCYYVFLNLRFDWCSFNNAIWLWPLLLQWFNGTRLEWMELAPSSGWKHGWIRIFFCWFGSNLRYILMETWFSWRFCPNMQLHFWGGARQLRTSRFFKTRESSSITTIFMSNANVFTILAFHNICKSRVWLRLEKVHANSTTSISTPSLSALLQKGHFLHWH